MSKYQIGEYIEISNSSIISEVKYNNDGTRFASCGYDSMLRQWDAETGEQIGESIKVPGGYILCLCYSPDGKRIATGTYGCPSTLCQWDAITGEQIGEQNNDHIYRIWSVKYSLMEDDF